jgi:hypothetical protein
LRIRLSFDRTLQNSIVGFIPQDGEPAFRTNDLADVGQKYRRACEPFSVVRELSPEYLHDLVDDVPGDDQLNGPRNGQPHRSLCLSARYGERRDKYVAVVNDSQRRNKRRNSRSDSIPLAAARLLQ